MQTGVPLDKPEWDEETETEFAEFAQRMGFSEMPRRLMTGYPKSTNGNLDPGRMTGRLR